MSKVSFQTFYLFCSSLYAFNSMSIRFFHEWLTRRQLSIDIGSTWLRIWTPMWLSPGFNINWSIIEEQLHPVHGVWKSQKKSHSTLRTKRATSTFWVDKNYWKMPKFKFDILGDFQTLCLFGCGLLWVGPHGTIFLQPT